MRAVVATAQRGRKRSRADLHLRTLAPPATPGTLSVQIATASNRGARDNNDDVVLAARRLVILADGMGGHVGGAAAATAATGAALAALPAVTSERLRSAFEQAQGAVKSLQVENPDFHEAGCTLTVVALRYLPMRGVAALVGHVGDSPAFRVRGDDLELLTRPHTIAEQLREEGRITDEDATRHPGRHTLSRAIGGSSLTEPEIREVEVEPGDRLLVASDGLLEVPDRRKLRALATQKAPVEDVVDDLMSYALTHSDDNVTIGMMDPWTDDEGVTGVRSD